MKNSAELMTKKQSVDSLKSFYDLMARTRNTRYQAVNQLIFSQGIQDKQVDALKAALDALENSLTREYHATLVIGSSNTIDVDLTYEIKELKKDIHYLENGEDKFISYLESLHSGFSSHVQSGLTVLREKQFNCFITDRDGTTNNYCGRYRSSIQSIYNAVFLSRFAKNCASSPIMITSAPLKDIGITDVSTIPEKTIIFAASKGREFIDLSGTRRSFPIEDEKQAIINRLNNELSKLVRTPTYEIFSLIGSGLQFKFGQTTIARQDISGSIGTAESDAFLALIMDMVKRLDPAGDNFRIEDTGLDIEIILTVSDQKDGLKDFDKADAIKFLDKELKLQMEKGPHLICGDTGSDVPMLEVAMAGTNDTWSIFVTKDHQLVNRVKAVCPDAVFVPEPDILITILNELSIL
jgi:hypothetical protein